MGGDSIALARQVRRYATPVVATVKSLDQDYILQTFGGHVLFASTTSNYLSNFYLICSNLHSIDGGGIGMSTESNTENPAPPLP